MIETFSLNDTAAEQMRPESYETEIKTFTLFHTVIETDIRIMKHKG